MKKLKLLLFGLAVMLVSCDDTKFRTEDPLKVITLHILDNIDTTQCYRVYIQPAVSGSAEHLYIVNQDNVVEYDILNRTGSSATVLLLLFTIIVIFAGVIIIKI